MTGYGLGFNSWWRQEIFSTPQLTNWSWGPPSLLSNVYQQVKWLGREADNSLPRMLEVYLYSLTVLQNVVLN
jgi:hypothetical protein